jgi:hypothetical protein
LQTNIYICIQREIVSSRVDTSLVSLSLDNRKYPNMNVDRRQDKRIIYTIRTKKAIEKKNCACIFISDFRQHSLKDIFICVYCLIKQKLVVMVGIVPFFFFLFFSFSLVLSQNFMWTNNGRSSRWSRLMLTFLLSLHTRFPSFLYLCRHEKRRRPRAREREKKERTVHLECMFEGVALKWRSTLPANKYTYYTFIQAYSRSQNWIDN